MKQAEALKRRKGARNSMHLKLRLALFFLLIPASGFAGTDNTSHVPFHPSFNCADAATPIEKLICSDEGLAAKDNELSDTWRITLRAYSGGQRASFIKGQKIWLGLRGKACPIANESSEDSEKVKCLSSIYEQRIAMLKQQLSAHKDVPRVDFDSLLDKSMDLSDIDPKEGGALHLKQDSGVDFETLYLPKTCRELYTLSAGNWGYYEDTIGVSAGSFAKMTCAFMTLSKLDSGHASAASKRVIEKELKKALASIEDETDQHDITKAQFGDFSHRNRNEVLAIVFSHGEGTLHFFRLYYGYYDKLNHGLEFNEVDADSLFQIQIRSRNLKKYFQLKIE